MAKLINLIDDIFEEEYDITEECTCEDCNCENSDGSDFMQFGNIIFVPITKKSTGEIVGFTKLERCPDCGEFEPVDMLTDGSIDLELIAQDFGFRDDDFEEDEYEEEYDFGLEGCLCQMV